MPSSNPLPPKENALFKRILVSIICHLSATLASELERERAAFQKILTVSTWYSTLIFSICTDRLMSFANNFANWSAHSAIRTIPPAINILASFYSIYITQFYLYIYTSISCRDVTNRSNTRTDWSSPSRSCQIQSTPSMGVSRAHHSTSCLLIALDLSF